MGGHWLSGVTKGSNRWARKPRSMGLLNFYAVSATLFKGLCNMPLADRVFTDITEPLAYPKLMEHGHRWRSVTWVTYRVGPRA